MVSLDLAEYELEGLVNAGRIAVCDDPDAVSLPLERRFRFAAGQLQWSDAKEIKRISPPASRRAGADHQATDFKTKDWLIEVKRFIDSLGLNGDETVYLASEFSDFVVFSLKMEEVAELLDKVHDLPSHKYIFPADASWCIHWSFEDEVVYGEPNDK